MAVSKTPGKKGPGRWSTFGQTPPAPKKPSSGGFERQSPGVYRGPSGGLVNSASNPGRVQPKGPIFGGGLEGIGKPVAGFPSRPNRLPPGDYPLQGGPLLTPPGGVGLSPPPGSHSQGGALPSPQGPPGSIPVGNDMATPPIRPGIGTYGGPGQNSPDPFGASSRPMQPGIAPQGGGPMGPPMAGAPGGQPMPQPNPNLWNAFGAALQRPKSPRGEISY